MDIIMLGPTIAQYRKKRGLTQQGLCKELQISRVTLSAFETGKKLSLSLRQLGRILARLDLELELKERTELPNLDHLIQNNKP